MDVDVDYPEQTTTFGNLIEHLDNAPIQKGYISQWCSKGSGRTLEAALNPVFGNGIAYITPKGKNASGKTNDEISDTRERMLYHFDTVAIKTDPKLIKETADIFVAISSCPWSSDSEGGCELRRFIQLYRQKIESFAKLKELSQQDNTAWEDADFYTDCISIWLCAEACLFPSPDEISLCEGILLWVNTLDPSPDVSTGVDIMRTRPPSCHVEYWPYIHKALLRGLYHQASSCLQNGGLPQSDLLADVIDLIIRAPREKNLRLTPMAHNEWKTWNGLVVECLHYSKDYDLQLSIILQILSGDKDIIFELAESWQEAMAALSLYVNPFKCAVSEDIQSLYKETLKTEKFFLDETLEIERFCGALFNHEFPKALTCAARIDLATATHLADLMTRAGLLHVYENEVEEANLLNAFLLDYGELCFTFPLTQLTALSYWQAAGNIGRYRTLNVISHIRPSSFKEMTMLTDICENLGLYPTANSIQIAWAKQLISQNLFSQAITILEQISSFVHIENYVWQMFEHALVRGKFPQMDSQMLDYFNSPQTISITPIAKAIIAPLACLYLYSQYLQVGDNDTAISYLQSLLLLQSFPKKLLGLLVVQLLHFLNLNSASLFLETSSFLAAIEDVESNGYFEDASGLISLSLNYSPSEPLGLWKLVLPQRLKFKSILEYTRFRYAEALALHSLSVGKSSLTNFPATIFSDIS